jgi:hypothetical protein
VDRKKLIDYLTPFTQQFLEMQEIMNASNISTDVIDENIENTLDNAFILSADEIGLTKFEGFLNLTPSVSDGIEERRKKVLSEWNKNNNFTISTLKKKLAEYCGDGNYEICTDSNLVNYYIHLSMLSNGIDIPTLKNFLETWLPANLQRAYDFAFKHNKPEFFALISVFKTYYLHTIQAPSLNDLPDWYVDDENNMLLDDEGNIIIMEG